MKRTWNPDTITIIPKIRMTCRSRCILSSYSERFQLRRSTFGRPIPVRSTGPPNTHPQRTFLIVQLQLLLSSSSRCRPNVFHWNCEHFPRKEDYTVFNVKTLCATPNSVHRKTFCVFVRRHMLGQWLEIRKVCGMCVGVCLRLGIVMPPGWPGRR